MDDFDRSFKRTQRFVFVFIGIVFALLLAYFAGIAWLAYKTVSTAEGQDWSGGIKPVIERLWCGKPGCFGGGS